MPRHISSCCWEEIWLLNPFPSDWKVKSKRFIIMKTTRRIVDFTEAIIFEIGGEKSEEIWSHRFFFFFFAAKKKEMKKEMMLFHGKILVTLILPPKFSHPYNKGNWVLFAWVRQWTFVSVSWILFAIIQLVPFDLEINCITQKYDLKLPSMKSALSELKVSLSVISWNKIQ